ncbi:ABC transporter permease, partial [Clostridioides difficile]
MVFLYQNHFLKPNFKNHLKYFQRGVLFMSGIISVMTQSLILSIMALGVYITYKILDFPDMSADGSYTMGA